MFIKKTSVSRLALLTPILALSLSGCGSNKKDKSANAELKAPEVKNLEVSPEGKLSLSFSGAEAGFDCYLQSSARSTTPIDCNGAFNETLLVGEQGAKVVVLSRASGQVVREVPVSRPAAMRQSEALPLTAGVGSAPSQELGRIGNPDGTFNFGLTHVVSLPPEGNGRLPAMRVLSYSNIQSTNGIEVYQIAQKNFDIWTNSSIADAAVDPSGRPLPGVSSDGVFAQAGSSVGYPYFHVSMPKLNIEQPLRLNQYGQDEFHSLRNRLRMGYNSWNSLEVIPEAGVANPPSNLVWLRVASRSNPHDIVRSRVRDMCQTSLRRDQVSLYDVPALQGYFPGTLSQGVTFRICEAIVNLPNLGPKRVHAGYFETCNVIAGPRGDGCMQANVQTEALLFEAISIPGQLDNSMGASAREWALLSQMLVSKSFYQGENRL